MTRYYQKIYNTLKGGKATALPTGAGSVAENMAIKEKPLATDRPLPVRTYPRINKIGLIKQAATAKQEDTSI